MQSVLDLIGHTRLLNLRRVHAGPGRLVAKAEFVQPGGSVKDRAAKIVIESALWDGSLKPDQPVVEMTSGNMGSALAVVCAVYGHPLTVTMSEGNSPERIQILEQLGVRVERIPQVDGRPGQVTGSDIEAAIARAKEIAAEQGAFYVDQFNNPVCAEAHEHGTAPEIWEQVAGQLDAFVACVGTGATFLGASRFFKRQRSPTLCVAVEPEGAEVLAGKPVTKPQHKLQGTGYGRIPPLWEPKLIDAAIAIGDEEAEKYRELLAKREGLYVGYSAAANVAAAIKVLTSGKFTENATVATVLCDAGWKYS
ncbi:MAG: cysteine synthase family protein [Acidobacteriaceae bacterium]|nr:cysteine synthase family protein [Acidobacteriaceae bacterium]